MTNKTSAKNRLRRTVLWATMAIIFLLMIFSIYGAFIGTERARRFFNSIPLSVYWAVFTLLLLAGIILFRRLLRMQGLFLLHLGCVLVLAGGIYGSRAGFKIRDSLLGTDTIREGQMIVYEGRTTKSILTENEELKELPFEIKLLDFKIEYYEPGMLLIHTAAGHVFKVKAEPGTNWDMGKDYGTVEIVRPFKSFKIIIENNKRMVIDDPEGKSNPALELLLKRPDGSEVTKYAFERFAGHVSPDDNVTFSYQRMIRDFISDLEVLKDTSIAARKSIEVNKPLHFGGYFFYQNSYDDIAGRYSVLSVKNDKGLMTVYLGYICLCAGLFWHLWFRHLFRRRRGED